MLWFFPKALWLCYAVQFLGKPGPQASLLHSPRESVVGLIKKAFVASCSSSSSSSAHVVVE